MDDVKPGEHPLMSNKTLQAMYTRMVQARVLLAKSRRAEDVACWVSATVGLTAEDVGFGCRPDGVLGVLHSGAAMPLIAGGVERLYAAVGAASMLKSGKDKRVVLAFFERHEVEKAAWLAGLRLAAELPLMVVVLPRWKGAESEMDLCREARTVEVPGIPVDGSDAVALYRVAQESLGRAREDGGGALIEAVRFALPKGKGDSVDAVGGLGDFLLRRGIASEAWMAGVRSKFEARR